MKHWLICWLVHKTFPVVKSTWIGMWIGLKDCTDCLHSCSACRFPTRLTGQLFFFPRRGWLLICWMFSQRLSRSEVIGVSCWCWSHWLVCVGSITDVSCLPLCELVFQLITHQVSVDNWLVIQSSFWCWWWCLFFLSDVWLVCWFPL